MQISAKATFLGFVQSLDPHTGLLEIAGIKIALAHTGGAVAGDVLQVEAVRDDTGAWSGVISTHLIAPRFATPARNNTSQRANADAPPIPASPARSAATVAPPGRSAAPATAPARRFGLPAGPAQAQARPRFSPTAADERVSY